ncbi:MAG: hypothetical protein ACD_45C00256G0001 [uncultured bacterium]|nr:MAG: hypothetical protein ACD_45C00256G0001 [uncultured bacterium]
MFLPLQALEHLHELVVHATEAHHKLAKAVQYNMLDVCLQYYAPYQEIILICVFAHLALKNHLKRYSALLIDQSKTQMVRVVQVHN